MSEKNEITKVEYGTDKTKAQIITSDGTIGTVIEKEKVLLKSF